MVRHGNIEKREALMNISPLDQNLLIVRCWFLKTQLRNYFLFINLSKGIKFPKQSGVT